MVSVPTLSAEACEKEEQQCFTPHPFCSSARSAPLLWGWLTELPAAHPSGGIQTRPLYARPEHSSNSLGLQGSVPVKLVGELVRLRSSHWKQGFELCSGYPQVLLCTKDLLSTGYFGRSRYQSSIFCQRQLPD